MYTGLFILRPRVADADYLIEVQDDQDVAAASVYINHAAENIELLINDLPVGVSAIIGALQAPGETAITLEGLEQLAPGDYPFSYSLSYDQELRIFDGLIRVNNVVAPFIAQLAPTTGAVLPEQTVTLEWSDNFNASDYHVIVAFETEDLSNVIFETDLTENSVTIPFDLPNGIYYWTVSGSGLCDTSGESTTGSFSVNWVSVDELAAEKFYAFPNPTQGQLTIVNSGEQLSWNLSDELGRVVLSGSLAAKTSGTIDMRGLANGVYILSDMNGKRTRVVKQ
jgi:hypothetical protein